jgi:hypothetical protein
MNRTFSARFEAALTSRAPHAATTKKCAVGAIGCRPANAPDPAALLVRFTNRSLGAKALAKGDLGAGNP